MLANFFDKTKPFNSIVLVFLFLSFYSTYVFLHNPPVFVEFSALEAITNVLLHILFLFLGSVIFIKNGVANENLHNTLILILLYGMFPDVFNINNTLYISILFLLIYRKLGQIKNKGNILLSLFDVGILSGIAFLLYNWSILFLLFIYLGIFIAQKISFKNILSPILGFFVPIFLFFTYSFLTEHLDSFLQKFIFEYSFDYRPTFIKNQTPLLVLSIVSIISIFSVLPKVLSVSNSYRFQYILALSMLFIGIFIIALAPEKLDSEMLLIFIPTSILLGRFIKTISKKRFKELFVLILAIFSIAFLIKNS